MEEELQSHTASKHMSHTHTLALMLVKISAVQSIPKGMQLRQNLIVLVVNLKVQVGQDFVRIILNKLKFSKSVDVSVC